MDAEAKSKGRGSDDAVVRTPDSDWEALKQGGDSGASDPREDEVAAVELTLKFDRECAQADQAKPSR